MASRKIILLLSGEIASGKSTLANQLSEVFGFQVLKTSDYLKENVKRNSSFKGKPAGRETFQKFGNYLDKNTEGKWVLTAFQEKFSSIFAETELFLVDSVRILKQIKSFRDSYSHAVYHVHLTASNLALQSRFEKRDESRDETFYEKIKQDTTEKSVKELSKQADLIIDSEKCTIRDVLYRVAAFFKLLPPTDEQLVDVIIGGQFGSEGKGQISGYLAPEYDCLLRVGGPNAGHTVYETPSPDVFHILPSGTRRNPNAQIILGPGTVINSDKLLDEIGKFELEDSSRLVIDENAIIISQRDIDYELANNKISSTAQGVGHATANNLLARLMMDETHKAKNSNILKKFVSPSFDHIEKLYKAEKKILLEGTQGSYLSIHHGLYPHVTSRDTTVSGCLSEAGISPKRVRKIIMATRTYPIRVGGPSGGFVSQELTWQEISTRSGIPLDELLKHEKTTTTKKQRRVAEFSWDLFRRACEINSPTDIALTFVDYFTVKNRDARRYELLSDFSKQFIEEVERCAGVKVSLISTCFDYRAIIDRRNWK